MILGRGIIQGKIIVDIKKDNERFQIFMVKKYIA